MRIATLSLILLLSGAAGAADKDTCFECHSVIEGMSEVFKDDVHYHNRQSCDACHGGDSKEEDQNISMNASRGFKVRVTRAGVPDYCGRCHSDAAFMHKYSPRQRVDQLSLYRTSVHAARLAANSPHAPECVDCHGVHTIRAVSDPLSPAHPSHVVEMCAKCHAAAAEVFKKSPHGKVFAAKGMSGCTTCHASHATQTATSAMLSGSKAVCSGCHAAGSAGARTAAELAGLMSGLETAARGANGSEAQRKAVNESLQKARLAVHAVSVAAVKIPVDAGMAATKQ
jgi:predicted CXXCH cytochrome family protein